MKEQTIYLTFPIMIFKYATDDIKKSVNDAMRYCLYDHCKDKTGNQSELIAEAEAHLGIKYGNKKDAYKEGELLFNSIPERSPKTSISKAMIFDFYKNDKTEFEVITFISFAAIRSIIQKQGYTKITNDYLIGRMSGNSKAGEPIPNNIFKYNNRYQIDKIKKELQLNWGLKLYGFHTRGFYVSFSMALVELIKHAEIKRKKTKEKELEQQKKEARMLVLKQINGTT